MEKIYIEIGRNIKYARNLVGLRQEDLAKKLDITRASMVNIEAGRQRISVEKLVIVAQTTGFAFSEFLENKGDGLPNVPVFRYKNIELLKQVDSLPTKAIRAIIKLYKSVGITESTGESDCTLCGVVGGTSINLDKAKSPYSSSLCSQDIYK